MLIFYNQYRVASPFERYQTEGKFLKSLKFKHQFYINVTDGRTDPNCRKASLLETYYKLCFKVLIVAGGYNTQNYFLKSVEFITLGSGKKFKSYKNELCSMFMHIKA